MKPSDHLAELLPLYILYWKHNIQKVFSSVFYTNTLIDKLTILLLSYGNNNLNYNPQ